MTITLDHRERNSEGAARTGAYSNPRLSPQPAFSRRVATNSPQTAKKVLLASKKEKDSTAYELHLPPIPPSPAPSTPNDGFPQTGGTRYMHTHEREANSHRRSRNPSPKLRARQRSEPLSGMNIKALALDVPRGETGSRQLLRSRSRSPRPEGNGGNGDTPSYMKGTSTSTQKNR